MKKTKKIKLIAGLASSTTLLSATALVLSSCSITRPKVDVNLRVDASEIKTIIEKGSLPQICSITAYVNDSETEISTISLDNTNPEVLTAEVTEDNQIKITPIDVGNINLTINVTDVNGVKGSTTIPITVSRPGTTPSYQTLIVDASKVPTTLDSSNFTEGWFEISALKPNREEFSLDPSNANVRVVPESGQDVIEADWSTSGSHVNKLHLKLKDGVKVGNAGVSVYITDKDEVYTGGASINITVLDFTPEQPKQTLIVDASQAPTTVKADSTEPSTGNVTAKLPDGSSVTIDDSKVVPTASPANVVTVNWNSASHKLEVRPVAGVKSGIANVYIPITDTNGNFGAAIVSVTVYSDPAPSWQTAIIDASSIPTSIPTNFTTQTFTIGAKKPDGTTLTLSSTNTTVSSTDGNILTATLSANNQVTITKKATGEARVKIDINDTTALCRGGTSVGITVTPDSSKQVLIVNASAVPTQVEANKTDYSSGTVSAKLPDGSTATITSVTITENPTNIVDTQVSGTNIVQVKAHSGVKAGSSANLYIEVADNQGNIGSATVNVDVVSESTAKQTLIVDASKVPTTVDYGATTYVGGAITVTLPGSSSPITPKKVTVTSSDTNVITATWQNNQVEVMPYSQTATGSANVNIYVEDDDGNTGGAIVQVTIKEAPTPEKQTLIVDASAVPTTLDYASTEYKGGALKVTLPGSTASVTPKTVNITSSPANIVSTQWTNNEVQVKPYSQTVSGTANLFISVTDDDGNSGGALVQVTVKDPSPTPTKQTLIVDASGIPGTINASDSEKTCTLQAYLASAPTTAVTLKKTTVTSSNPNLISVTASDTDGTIKIKPGTNASAGGTANLYITTTDADGNVGGATVQVSINFQTLIVNASSIPASIVAGAAEISCPIYAYLPNGATGTEVTIDGNPQIIHSPGNIVDTTWDSTNKAIKLKSHSEVTSGTTNLYISLKDTNGNKGSVTLNVSVTSTPDPVYQTLIVNSSAIDTSLPYVTQDTTTSYNLSATKPDGTAYDLTATGVNINVTSTDTNKLTATWNTSTHKIDLVHKANQYGNVGINISIIDNTNHYSGGASVGIILQPEPAKQTLIVDASAVPTSVVAGSTTAVSGVVTAKLPDGSGVTINDSKVTPTVSPSGIVTATWNANTDSIEVTPVAGVESGSANIYIPITDTAGNFGAAVVSVSVTRDAIMKITYSDLVQKSKGKLIVGQQYQITDYVATTTQAGTKGYVDSASGHENEHKFDILVTAVTASELDENVKIVKHDGDNYFLSTALNLWTVKYSLDNNKNLYSWADTQNGKGVIYYMKDEYSNEAGYDFKNILFTRDNVDYYTFSATNDLNVIVDESLWGTRDAVYGNKIAPCYDTDEKGYILNNIIFCGQSIATGSIANFYNNTFAANCSDMFFSHDCYGNNFGTNCFDNTFDEYCSDNFFGNNCNGINVTQSNHNNPTANAFIGNTFGNDCTDINISIKDKTTTGGPKYVMYNTFGAGVTTLTMTNISFANNIIFPGVANKTFTSDTEDQLITKDWQPTNFWSKYDQ